MTRQLLDVRSTMSRPIAVEVHYEPTSEEVNVLSFLRWLMRHGKNPHEEKQKQAPRDLMK